MLPLAGSENMLDRTQAPPQPGPPPAPRYAFGDFQFEPVSGELRTADGEPVQLEPQPAKVLHFLLRRAGSVVSRVELQHHLWPDQRHVEADQGLNYCVRELRRALDDSARDPRYIETLRRRGYRFVEPVELVPEVDVPAPLRHPASARRPGEPRDGVPEEPPPLPPRRIPWLPLAGILTIGALLGLWALRGPEANKAPGPAADLPRVGVLAFDAPGGGEGGESTAAAVATALVSELSRLGSRGLEVIPGTSSFSYAGSGKTVSEIGAELRADYLMEGSVRLADGSAVVDVRLVETEGDSVVWTRTYGAWGHGPDVLAAAVARDVTTSLGVGAPEPPRDEGAADRREATPANGPVDGPATGEP